nr:2-oxoglutarate and iron-dependent oxygenase domain-containing protein 3 isoform X4 [Manis javanica]
MTASLRSWLTVVRSCQAGSSRCPAPRTTTVTEGCSPRKCGRGVTDTVITRDEARRIRSIAEKGLSLGGSEGGASILDLHSGALSMGKHFVNLYRYFGDKIQTVFAEEDFQLYRHVRQKVQLAIAQAFGISASSLYLTKPTFFSRINSTEARMAHDEYWRAHVDKVTYGSFDYTSLLYLSDYLDDFGGGRFVFIDEGANRTVEPRAAGAAGLVHSRKQLLCVGCPSSPQGLRTCTGWRRSTGAPATLSPSPSPATPTTPSQTRRPRSTGPLLPGGPQQHLPLPPVSAHFSPCLGVCLAVLWTRCPSQEGVSCPGFYGQTEESFAWASSKFRPRPAR